MMLMKEWVLVWLTISRPVNLDKIECIYEYMLIVNKLKFKFNNIFLY